MHHPRYDPARDPENFPLVFWTCAAAPGFAVYLPDQNQYGWECDGQIRAVVDPDRLCAVAGLPPYERPRAFPQGAMAAADRYFRHEAWLATLSRYDPSEDED
jgi:hypothetical protein